MNGIVKLKIDDPPENEEGVAGDLDEPEKTNDAIKTTPSGIIRQEKMPPLGRLASRLAQEIDQPMHLVAGNLGILGKYLDRLEDFIHAQSALIEMVTDEGASAGLREKRRRLNLDHLVADGRELIRNSLEGTARVLTITQSLDNYSRMNGVESRHSDINECLMSAVEIALKEIRNKVTVTKALGDIPLIRCRTQQIRQAFTKLLLNAFQAIEGEIKIDLRTWYEKSFIFVRLTCTGRGNHSSNLKSDSEPYSTTREGGHDLTLPNTTSCRIVREHNGEIIVESDKGMGAIFTVRLPVLQRKRD